MLAKFKNSKLRNSVLAIENILTNIEQKVDALSNKVENRILFANDTIICMQIRDICIAFPVGQLNYAISYLNTNFDSGMYSALKNNITPGSLCIDIGADIGVYSALMAKLTGEKGKVIAVEPIKSLTEFIDKNLFLNSALTKKEIINKAVSNKQGTIEIQIFPEDTRISTIHLYSNTEKDIKCTTEAVSLIQIKDLINLDYENLFIKIDAEGEEFNIVNDLLNLELEQNLTVVFEYAKEHTMRSRHKPKEFLELMQRKNIQAYFINELTGEKEMPFDENSLTKTGNVIFTL